MRGARFVVSRVESRKRAKMKIKREANSKSPRFSFSHRLRCRPTEKQTEPKRAQRKEKNGKGKKTLWKKFSAALSISFSAAYVARQPLTAFDSSATVPQWRKTAMQLFYCQYHQSSLLRGQLDSLLLSAAEAVRTCIAR